MLPCGRIAGLEPARNTPRVCGRITIGATIGVNVRPHLWTLFEAVRSRLRPPRRLACHMVNESYFRNASVTWNATAGKIEG